jgi:hypothetical protein
MLNSDGPVVFHYHAKRNFYEASYHVIQDTETVSAMLKAEHSVAMRSIKVACKRVLNRLLN